MKKILSAIMALSLLHSYVHAQTISRQKQIHACGYIAGYTYAVRTCYDINYYHLDVKFDIDNKFISGSNQFKFTATQDFTKLQFDLFDNLKVEKVVYKDKELPYTREFNAVFVTFPQTIAKGSHDEFTVYYSGNPIIAKNAPWDGGVVIPKTLPGNPGWLRPAKALAPASGGQTRTT